MKLTMRNAAIAGLIAGLSMAAMWQASAQNPAHSGHAAPVAPAPQGPAGKPDAAPTMSGMHHGMRGSGATVQPSGDRGPSSQAFDAINAQMHQAMAITFSGDADVDFAKAMIPHHQGAIDMAKVVVGFGKDPEIRKLAESVIKAQEAEIAQMNAWLKAKGK